MTSSPTPATAPIWPTSKTGCRSCKVTSATLRSATDTLKRHQIDTVVHFAAESHNSLAVLDPARFFRTNVLGTQTMLEAARRSEVTRFHHISTCEVYGDLALDSEDSFKEEDAYRPRTPYNASKAGADHAVRAYGETFGLPATITNCSNNYGPYQFPEKIIPLFTANALDDIPLPLYASTGNRREWLHVIDHCRAIDFVLERGRIGETYHVGSGVEASIEEIADIVLDALGKPSSLKTIVPDRPGHDRRYLLDCTKITKELGWEPTIGFDSGSERDGAVVQGQPKLVGAPQRPCSGGGERVGARRRPALGLRLSAPSGRPMRILVTGAGGQLGQDLVDTLSGDVPPAGGPLVSRRRSVT